MRPPFFAVAAVAAGLISFIQQTTMPASAVFNVQSLRTFFDDLSQANQFFILQYRSQFNPDASNSNANCGRASLAVALKRFFARESIGSRSSPEKRVHIARLAMTGNEDPNGNTDNFDVVRGAQRLSLRADIARDLAGIDNVLAAGGMAVVSVSPSVPGSFAHRQQYRDCHGGHFIVIAGKHGDNYVMNYSE